MARKLGFKPSFQDQRRANKAAHEYYAAISGKETPPEQAILHADVKPKVARGARKPRDAADGLPESEVQKNIINFLMRHYRVVLVIRTNSGAVGADGRYIEFNHVYLPHRFRAEWPAVTPKMLISDLQVILTDAQFAAIECKPEKWMRSYGDSDKAVREQGQENYLLHVRACGGIGIFARSIDDVSAVL